jgi:predicted dehydrogenase
MKSVGIIGTGWIFKNEHVLGYLATNNGFIKGFFDISEEIAKPAMELYRKGIMKRQAKASTQDEKELCQKALEFKFYSDVDEMLKVVDAVDICTPPKYHTLYAKMAADQGKTVLCEKPLARSYLDAKDALESLKKVPFYIFTQVIYNPIFKYGKEIIDSGKIGEIVKMRCCHATLDLNHTIEKKAFWDPIKSGGGALKDIGPHAYSVMRYWLGKQYSLSSIQDNGIKTVMQERTIAGESNQKVIVEDLAKVKVNWDGPNGKTIETDLEAYWIDKKSLPKELGFGLYHEVVGTKGTMTFPNGTIGLLLKKKPYFGIHIFFKITYKDGTVEKLSMPNPKAHTETLIAIDEFLSGVESRSPAWYGEDMMLILDGAYISKKQGGKKLTVDEIQKYCDKFTKLDSADAKGEALVKDLFDL